MMRSKSGRWALVILLLLLTWGLRLCRLEEVPPGWRDDELINIHALSSKLLEGDFPLYFTGASGHEPLYHYLHAGVHAVLGFNTLSGHLLSAAFGTLTVPLVYALARRLFPRKHLVAVAASLWLATSFWSLMYSRIALRHISCPPFALATFLLIPIRRTSDHRGTYPERAVIRGWTRWIAAGLAIGVSLYTYPAARLLPLLLVLFTGYLALFHRERFRIQWRGYVAVLLVAAVLATPLVVAIARGRSEAAAQGIGADARLAELAVPLRELRAGNPRPLLQTTWTTLGMFHAIGDPEWLYNISGRPVFNLSGGLLLWGGVALCLYHWRQPRYFFMLLWLGMGLFPAFASTPPASLSHTILTQPPAYILPALVISGLVNWDIGKPVGQHQLTNPPTYRLPRIISRVLVLLLLATNIARDLHDYFVTWPERGIVGFLYRAEYRDTAHYLDTHPDVTDVAVSSALRGPWDRLAVEVDTRREDVAVRLFNPERALVWTGGEAPSVVLLAFSHRPAKPVKDLLDTSAISSQSIPPHLMRYTLTPTQEHTPGLTIRAFHFANGLSLTEARWIDEESLDPGQEAALLTAWSVSEPLDLPPMPITANPPPPGVYSGPRLAAFAHLLDADGAPIAGDDGLWVDPLTLQLGDRFVQIYRFAIPDDAPPGPYTLELGLYDPKTGERWAVLDAGDQPFTDRLILR